MCPSNLSTRENTVIVYVLKYGSFEGVEVVDIFTTHAAAKRHAKQLALYPADSTGGYYIEEVEVKV